MMNPMTGEDPDRDVPNYACETCKGEGYTYAVEDEYTVCSDQQVYCTECGGSGNSDHPWDQADREAANFIEIGDYNQYDSDYYQSLEESEMDWVDRPANEQPIEDDNIPF